MRRTQPPFPDGPAEDTFPEYNAADQIRRELQVEGHSVKYLACDFKTIKVRKAQERSKSCSKLKETRKTW